MDADAVRHAASLIRRHPGPLVVVASALGGVTDALLEGARRSAAGDGAAAAEVAADFLRRHRDLAVNLIPAGSTRKRLLRGFDAAAREYREIARAVSALGDLSPRASDALLARGERASSALMAAVVLAMGRPSERVDAAEIVVTDGHHGMASVDLRATRRAVGRRLRPLIKEGVTPVVPGFIGSAPDGSVATLGRGGSDLTATLLARTLGSRRVVLWKDVSGILTADPRSVPDARLVPQLHHREAAEVAYFGAKVLHPRALIPLDGSRVALHVRSFLDPERSGTVISAGRMLAKHPAKALATIEGQAVVTVAGKGMIGVPGIAARTFAAVAGEGLSVSTIFQASSESSIGFTLPDTEADRAVAALRAAFREELAAGLIDDVASRAGVAVVAVVGSGVVGTPGVAARVFTALASGGINVIAIVQGSSELNISFVVAQAEAPEAARRVHAAFQLSKIGGGHPSAESRSDLVLLGFGQVGRALAEQLAALHGSGVRLVGLVDRSGFVFDPGGLSRGRLLRLVREKRRGGLLADLGGEQAAATQALAFVASHALSRPILVDVTAEETGDLLRSALDQGFDLVLANKKPLAGSRRSYESLVSAAERAGRRLRYEATVGAGLPILDTLRKLLESGDRVLRVEGCVSGTLAYVLSAVSEGRPFSTALREAMERGYTEPDPREDLSGRDVGRKGLILARLLGYTGGVPKAETLVPKALRRVRLSEFLDRLPSLDAGWRDRVDRAASRDRVLRYLVSASRSAVRAQLVAVRTTSAIGSSSGSSNLVSFTTRRYRAEPLIVIGPGAGAEVTAAGILSDIRQLAGS